MAHTSLITTLNVMYEKLFVNREAAGGARGYAFSPKLSRDEVPIRCFHVIEALAGMAEGDGI